MVVRRKSAARVPPVPAEAATGAGHEVSRFLSGQGLEHTPNNFSLTWRLETDHHSITTIAVDAILMEGRNLTQADADTVIAAETLGHKVAGEASDPRHESLRHQTLRLADIAAGAATPSSDFGRDLSAGISNLTVECAPSFSIVISDDQIAILGLGSFPCSCA